MSSSENPMIVYLKRHPELSTGLHMKAVGTGLLRLFQMRPHSAIRIALSIMEGSAERCSYFSNVVNYIESKIQNTGDSYVLFKRSLESYNSRPESKHSHPVEWIELYDHARALSFLVEISCKSTSSVCPVDNRGACNPDTLFFPV